MSSTPTRHRRPAIALVATMAALALPAAAGADTYCVNKDACPGGQPKPDISSALAAAKNHAGPDRVEIGPSDAPYSHAGTLMYDEPAGNRVTIVGSGTTETTLTTPGLSEVLFLGEGSSVRALRIELAGAGKGLQIDGATAEDIFVHGAGNQSGAIGIVSAGNAHISHSVVQLSSGTGVHPVGLGGLTRLTDSRVSAGSAVFATTAAILVRHSRLTGRIRGAAVYHDGGKLQLDDTLVLTTGAGATGLEAGEGALLEATNATVAGTGASTGTGKGAWVHSAAAGAGLTLSNSIVDGYAESVRCEAEAAGPMSTVLVGSSNYDPATASASPSDGCAATFLPGNVDLDPQWVNPDPFSPLVTASFRLRWSSPLIDAGENVFSAQDLDLNPRVVDGDAAGGARVDIGAYEYQRRAPTAALTGPDSAAVGMPVELSAVGSSDPDGGDTLAYSWSFGDGETATGKKVSHAFGAADTRDVTLTVTDPTGLADAATKTIAVAGAGPGASPEGGTAPGGAGATADTAAPVLSDVVVKPRRFRLGRLLARLSARANSGGAIRFGLSEPARVGVRFARARAGRGFVRVRGALRLDARAGVNRVRFQGRVSRRRSLRPGRYRLTITARDTAGNKAAPRRARFSVLPKKP